VIIFLKSNVGLPCVEWLVSLNCLHDCITQKKKKKKRIFFILIDLQQSQFVT
jgi:hypothetical protein